IASNNDVWVVNGDAALNGGVGHYNGTTWTYYNSSNSNLPTEQLTDIAIDQNNNKWITCNLGLIKYDGLNWIQFNPGNSGLSSGGPREVMIDSLNRVWVCNGTNIDIFDGTNWTYINNTTWPVANFDAKSMYIQGNKIILCETTNSSRVMMFDGTNWTWNWTNDFILSCYIDVNGNFWTAGANSVRKFDGTQWIKYTCFNTGLSENFNEDIFIDSKNNKWIANGNGGIHVLECPNWEIYGILNEGHFPIPQTQSYLGSYITETPDGDIWFSYEGSDGFAVQVPNGNYKNYASWVLWDKTNAHPWFQAPKEIAANDSGKVFFIADYTNNTFVYDKNTNTWTHYDITNGITAWPTCLAAHSGGKMYVCHIGGIDIYDNGIWSTWDLTTVGITHISDIEFDANNNLWLATLEGLWKYDGTTWTQWDITNSNIAATNVTNIKIDNTTNTIYASAEESVNFPYYGGISYFNGTGNVFTTFLQGTSPISEKYVKDLDIDTLGNLWIVTAGEGINVYNPNGVLGFECIDKTLQGGGTTSIDSPSSLNENEITTSPNPLQSTTTITFNLPSIKNTSLSLLDVLGRTVKIIPLGILPAGENKAIIDLSELNRGIYFCKIISNGSQQTVKLIKN
ncbi:MAG: T9SS type A sorting domain-containing protein, partial [Bacteroidia bacterium]